MVLSYADSLFLHKWSTKGSNLAKNDNFSSLSLFLLPMVKVKEIPKFYTLAILLINQSVEIGGK